MKKSGFTFRSSTSLIAEQVNNESSSYWGDVLFVSVYYPQSVHAKVVALPAQNHQAMDNHRSILFNSFISLSCQTSVMKVALSPLGIFEANQD